jgi:predicted MarR family transcription regulator
MPSVLVNYQQRLDRTFAALVDPTRRAILDAGLITRTKSGRPMTVRLAAAAADARGDGG